MDSSLIIEALGEYMLTRLHMLLLLLNQPKKNGHLLTNLLPTLHQNGDDLGDGDYEHVCALPTAVLLIPPPFPLSQTQHWLLRYNLDLSKYFLGFGITDANLIVDISCRFLIMMKKHVYNFVKF